jgi:hypothetical protein
VATFRKWFSAVSDLWTAYNWVVGATTWIGITSGSGVIVEQFAAAAGASPLQAIAFGLAAALVATIFGMLVQLYKLNKPAAKVELLGVYDEGAQIGKIKFTGIGPVIRLETYCVATEMIEKGSQHLLVPESKHGLTFSLARKEFHAVDVLKYSTNTIPHPVIDIVIPTKSPTREFKSGSKFKITVVGYAGPICAKIDLVCWVDVAKGRLHVEEVHSV